MNNQDAIELVAAVRQGEFEDETIEVKRAQKGLPHHLYETLSAFANRPEGGIILLGLDEGHGFQLTGIENVQGVLTELTDMAGKMMPPLNLAIVVVDIEEKSLIVAEVPECDYQQKPCFYAPTGMNLGAFLRVGNQSRRMTPYEIFSFVVGRGQPIFDHALVQSANLKDLDPDLVNHYLDRLERSRANIWNRLRLSEKDLVERLITLNIVGRDGEHIRPTLAGLLVFGQWPQKFYPSLMISFVRYFGTDSSIKGTRGERFLDNAQFEGPLTEMVDQAVNRCIANMKQATLIEGVLHRMIPEYPEEAVREAIVNAVVHRDYSPYVLGSQVRIEMYEDRLEIISPGGLFGLVNEINLETAQSARNQLLIHLLTEIGLVENRGSGIRAMVAAMREAHLEPPEFKDLRNYFRVSFSNQTLLDRETITWLNQYATFPLNARQRTALAYLRRHDQMTNNDYCRLNSVDSVIATRDLRGLVDAGLVAMHGTRRWAYYNLMSEQQVSQKSLDESTLNPRQQAAMAYLREHGQINVNQYLTVCGQLITDRTARNDLRNLEDKGFVKRVGEARSMVYTLPN